MSVRHACRRTGPRSGFSRDPNCQWEDSSSRRTLTEEYLSVRSYLSGVGRLGNGYSVARRNSRVLLEQQGWEQLRDAKEEFLAAARMELSFETAVGEATTGRAIEQGGSTSK